MSQNNVTPITKLHSNLTLASVSTAMDAWRNTRKRSNERMSEYLWDQIFALLKSEPGSDSKILSKLRVAWAQLAAEKQRRESTSSEDKKLPASPEELDFCEVKNNEEPRYPLVYKPAEAFTTTTSVVELYRKDGALMKIHICTERFDELLRAFFNGCP